MELIYKTIRKLIMNVPIAGLFLMGLRKKETKSVPTAAVHLVNGIDIEVLFNPDFYKSLNVKEQAAVLYHEVLHIMFEHLFIGTERWPDHEIANLATDCMINSLIDEHHNDGRMKLPEFVIRPSQYGLEPLQDSDLYYKKLVELDESAQQKLEKNGKSSKSSGDSGESESKKSEGKEKDEKEDENIIEKMFDEAGLTEPEKAITRQKQKLPGSLMQHHWDKITKGLTDEQKELIKSNVRAKLKQTIKSDERSRGLLPGYLDELVTDLFNVKEEVFNWKSYLRRYIGSMKSVTTKKTRKKNSLRFPGNPGRIKKKKHKMMFSIDTSGSVSQRDLEECYSELHHLWKKGTAIDVVHWDTSIVHEYKYNGEHTFPRVSSGGTSIECALNHFEKNIKEYTGLVLFTDGYVEETNFKCIKPILTIVCSGGVNEKYSSHLPGHVIKIPEHSV